MPTRPGRGMVAALSDRFSKPASNRGNTRGSRGRGRSGPPLPVRPSRALGQNFLQDPELAKWIADQLTVEPDDLVVELGPGEGALTAWLLGRGRRLLVIERDERLAEALAGRWSPDKIVVVAADAAEFDRRSLFAEGPVKLIGNLPYSVGTQLLLAWLDSPSPVSEAVFMLQKEVVDRLCAEPGGSDYGSLTLHVGLDWVAERLRTVGPEVFNPRPAVDSAVLRLRPRDPHTRLPVDRQRFESLVRTGFSQRRKQLKNLLPPLPAGSQWPELAARLGIGQMARAQELGLDQWIALTRHYSGTDGEPAGQCEDERFDVVDTGDQVIGQATRGEVHARGLLHRAVHVMLVNRAGEVWLQRRSHLKDRSALKWDSSAAGHVDAGEDYETAARRELKEELGLDLPLRACGELSASEATDFEFVRLYSAEWNGRALRYPPEEIDSGQFFTLDQVDRWIARRPEDFAPVFLLCWEQWRRVSRRGDLDSGKAVIRHDGDEMWVQAVE